MLYTLEPGALVQDLEPDNLGIDFMVAHKPDVVTEMRFPVERLDPAVIATHPVLCVYPYSHTLNVGSVIRLNIENRIP